MLALGFGTAWWSFVPATTAAASVPVAERAPRKALVVARLAPVAEPAHQPTIRLAALPRARHERRRAIAHVRPPVIVAPPVPIATPVNDLPAILPPVVETPVADDLPELPMPRIHTRSS